MLANILTLIVRCQLTPYSYVCDVSVPETQKEINKKIDSQLSSNLRKLELF